MSKGASQIFMNPFPTDGVSTYHRAPVRLPPPGTQGTGPFYCRQSDNGSLPASLPKRRSGTSYAVPLMQPKPTSKQTQGPAAPIGNISNAMVKQPNTTSPIRGGLNTEDRCKEIISAIRNNNREDHTEFVDVSAAEFAYIMAIVGDSDSCRKFTFYHDKQLLVLTTSSDIHESTITAIIKDLSSAIDCFGHNELRVQVPVHANGRFSGDTITGYPDIEICVNCPLSSVASLMDATPLWIWECAFTQTDKNVMDKLSRYANDCRELLAISKISIQEKPSFSSPGENSPITRQIQADGAHNYRTFSPSSRIDSLGSITVLGYDFINIVSIEFETWVRGSDGVLDLANRSPDVFAAGTLFPTKNTADIDVLLDRAMLKVRDYVLDVEVKEAMADGREVDAVGRDPVQCRPNVIRWDILEGALRTGAWNTASTRYSDYVNKLILKRAVDDDDTPAKPT